MKGRVALLWHDVEAETKARRARLDGVFRALATLGVAAEAVVYSDEVAEERGEYLLGFDGVLVWVNPITAGHDRSVLDGVLRGLAAAGVWVSAHPDVIDVLGTKEVLYRTRAVGWGSDVQLYRDAPRLRQYLPSRLAEGAVVLKRARGQSGLGVWKLELAADSVTVEHALDGSKEVASVDTVLERFAAELRCGPLIEQPFLPRINEGMVRCYISGAQVVGFSEHLARGFVPVDAPRRAESLGFEKLMYDSSAPAFRHLRLALESEWLPAMGQVLDLDMARLPAIWDADFVRGRKKGSVEDSWVLCEINASCVAPFPESAAGAIAATACERILQQRARG